MYIVCEDSVEDEINAIGPMEVVELVPPSVSEVEVVEIDPGLRISSLRHPRLQ